MALATPHLQHLQLTQFRSYTDLEIDLSPHINCFTGPNGAGKTNILDAIHYLSFTRGFRHHQDRQAVQDGGQFFFIGGAWKKGKSVKQVHCNYMQGKGKKLLINQKAVERMSDHIGLMPLVAILPSDTDLINGQSADRRRFLDMLISQYDHQFLHHLIHYERVLQQRNALLKLMAENRRFDQEQLSLWDDQLIPHGIAVKAGREDFLEAFSSVFASYFSEIVSDKETPKLQYKSQLDGNTTESWRNLLRDNLDKDRVNGYTVGGIHRDDLQFHIDEHSVRNYGSQGQQKTFVIALKLAQYQLLQEKTNLAPILLLDDLFDKLDRHRLGQISHLLQSRIQGQIFITDTSEIRLREIFGESKREVAYFSVLNSEVTVS
ncbi:MAG: DNA replication/repair protein RecF [Bacteroidia bacterium]|nr:DNA replication/repair protein RecF [Bacteroidia bacterium]